MLRKLWLVILAVQVIVLVEGYNTSAYTLGNNLVTNPYFLSPQLPSDTTFVNYPNNITNWACLTDCKIMNMTDACSQAGVTCTINFTQGLNFDTLGHLNGISQTVPIYTNGQYLLRVDWLPPFNSPVTKQFKIQLNSSLFANVTVTDSIYQTHTSEFEVNLTLGDLELTLTQFGSNPNGRGIILGGVALQEMIPNNSSFNSSTNQPSTNQTGSSNSSLTNSTSSNNSSSNNSTQTTNSRSDLPTDSFSIDENCYDEAETDIISLIMLNNYTRFINYIPGNRIFTSFLMRFMITFDRLQLYFYHRQNLTYYSYLLLSNVGTIYIEKDKLPQLLIQRCKNSSPICDFINSRYNDLLDALDYKYPYSDAMFLERNQNGIGFYANNLDFFYFTLPVIFLTYLVMHLIFRALFNYRISSYFRKYSFYGILLLLIYQGNVEQFTFYFFQECKNLFSSTFTHKVGNVLMIYFFFFTLVFSVSGLTWLMFHYKKLVKYFVQEYKVIRIDLITLESLERFFLPFIFGSMHSLLIRDLALQTIALGGVQVVYFATKIAYLRAQSVQFKFKIAIFTLTSLLRMILIVTFYLYEVKGNPAIINQIHQDIVWLYLISWMLQSLYDLIYTLVDVIKVVRRSCIDHKSPTLKSRKQRDQEIIQQSVQLQLTNKQTDQGQVNNLRENKKGVDTAYKHLNKPRIYYASQKWKSPRVQFFIQNKEIKPEDAPQAIAVVLMSPKKSKQSHH